MHPCLIFDCVCAAAPCILVSCSILIPCRAHEGRLTIAAEHSMQPAQEKLLQLHLRDQAKQKQRELDAAHGELQQAQVQESLRSTPTGCCQTLCCCRWMPPSLQAQVAHQEQAWCRHADFATMPL